MEIGPSAGNDDAFDALAAQERVETGIVEPVHAHLFYNKIAWFWFETVDRRGPQPVYASLNYDPSLSTIRFPTQLIARLFARATGATG